MVHIYMGSSYNKTISKMAVSYLIYENCNRIDKGIEIFEHHEKLKVEAPIMCDKFDKYITLGYSEIKVHCKSHELELLIENDKAKYSILDRFVHKYAEYNQKLAKLSICTEETNLLRNLKGEAKNILNKKLREVRDREYVIYASGSYDTLIYYGGCIVTKGKDILYEDFIADNTWLESGRYAGEILAIKSALDWCKENEVAKVLIKCSNSTIADVGNRFYKAKTELNSIFMDYLNNLDMDIIFIKDYIKEGNLMRRAMDIAERKVSL